MEKFEDLAIEELIRPEGFDCECGVHHSVAVKYIKIGRGAVKYVAEAVKALGCAKPFIVCDDNTFRAAGEQVCAVLDAAGISYVVYRVPENGYPKVEPDEHSLGSIAMHFDVSCDLIMGIGGGVINDLCKVFAFDCGRPQMIVGTAPSMDGFASNSSSMVVDGVKSTLYNRSPQAIVLDSEIMAQAPMRMLWAGLGDMVAKYISLCEWRISNLVIGEYYCEHVAELMRKALRKIMANSDGIAKRDPDSIAAVAEGLVLSGFAMSFAKISRPASGLEHYFSHFWDMIALDRGTEADLHGIQVGVGSVLTMNIYDGIKTLKPSREKAEAAMKAFDPVAWEANIRRVFGGVAPQVLAIEEKGKKNDPIKHAQRLNKTLENWDKIQQIIADEIPDKDWLFEKMRATGMPMSPEEIGISHKDTVDGFICTRDIRDKYLSSTLLWDLGELNDFAKTL